MNTQVMHDSEIHAACLEYYPAAGAPVQRIRLPSQGLTIGRDDTADLKLDSGRVSREHARIETDGDGFRVRDLSSTNGTFVNGRRIEQTVLCDGDLLMVADMELMFFAPLEKGRSPATQVIEGRAGRGAGGSSPRTIIREARRLHEMLACPSIRCVYQSVVDLNGDQTIGWHAAGAAGGGWPDGPLGPSPLASLECRLTDRLRQAIRKAAVKEWAQSTKGERLFLGVHACEIGTPTLLESLASLQSEPLQSTPLTIEIPESAAGDTPYFRELRSCLENLGMELAYASFASGSSRVLEYGDEPPAYLKLDPSLVRSLIGSSRHQDEVGELVAVCRDLGIRIIADGIRTQDEAQVCRDLGCPLGAGDFYGRPLPADALNMACAV